MVHRFLRTLESLDSESDFQRCVQILFEYLEPTDSEEFDWAIVYYLRDPGTPNRLKARLRDYVREATGSSDWMMEACKNAVKDVSETYTLMLDTAGVFQGSREGMTLEAFGKNVWSPFVRALKSGRESDVRAVWATLDLETGRLLNRLILRAPARRKAVSILATALAPLYESDPALMYWRLLHGPDIFGAYDDHLAELPSRTETDCLPLDWGFPRKPTQWSGEATPIGEWIVEPEYEGVRVQILRNSGGVYLWDEAGVLLNPLFPDLVEAARELPLGIALEGCVAAWDSDRPAEAGRLVQRLNREKASLEVARATPVRFFVSSALMEDWVELGDLDFEGRRRIAVEALDAMRSPPSLRRKEPKPVWLLGQLELFEPEPEPEATKATKATLSADEGTSWIAMFETLKAGSWGDVEAALGKARERRWVGARLWRRSSRTPLFGGERVESHFLPAPRLRAQLALVAVKVKLDSPRREIESLDFAARDGDALPVVATVPVDTFDPEWMDAIVEFAKRPLARKGPIVFVEPSRVFELECDRMVKTKKRRSGLSLVGARPLGPIEDASSTEVDTLSGLLKRLD